MASTIYDVLGTKPVINARGIYTDLGGSILSPQVWAAVEEANHSFVDMVSLLDQTGKIIAQLVGTEAARVTPGASAAIALGIAACMTGTDGEKMERLPSTDGMKNAVLIQRRHRYKYDRMVRMTGATLATVGDETGTTEEHLEAAIGPRTAAIFIPAHLDGIAGSVSLARVTQMGRRHGIPVFVDAAYLNFPVDRLRSFTDQGADLVCFSAKYFGGPNAGGFIAGRVDLIDAVAGVDFTRFESGDHLIFGRPFKLDRQTVVAVVVALQEWMTMDHPARFADYARKVGAIRRGLEDLPGISLSPMNFTMEETLEPEPVNCLVVRVDPASGATAREIELALRSGNPAVLVHLRDETLIVDVEMVRDGDPEVIVNRFRSALSEPVEILADTGFVPAPR
jgi:D-glucosaminate-6-phosphate ammonia-lyase